MSLLFLYQCASHVEQVCFILDDNAYIIAHSRQEHVGKFLGSVENKIMHLLKEEKIYEDVTIFDYQAVCYEDRNKDYEDIMDIMSSANQIFLNPLKLLWNIVLGVASVFWNLVYASIEFMPNCKLIKNDIKSILIKFYFTYSNVSRSTKLL